MAGKPEPAQPELLKHLTCGVAQGGHHGEGVVGCCYICGLLLCEEHVFHLPPGALSSSRSHFGKVEGEGATPLACERHSVPFGEPGLPKPAAATTSKPARKPLFSFLRPSNKKSQKRQSRRRA